ncbi:MAG: alpha/beta fold hydrolase [Acidimicrobiales bacterium]
MTTGGGPSVDGTSATGTIVLVHGGLYDGGSAEEWWDASGVIDALASRRLPVMVHRRPAQPTRWADESAALAATLADAGPMPVVVAAADGCSAALRLAVDQPGRIARLVLAWPAVAGDPVRDELLRVCAIEQGQAAVVDDLADGGTVRGVADAELAALSVPVVLWPTFPENQFHPTSTITRLAEAVPQPIVIGGSPLPTLPAFESFVDRFVSLVAEAAVFDEEDLAELS